MILDYLVRKSDFSTLLKFVSPRFFKVVPPKTVFLLANKINTNQSDKKAWRELRNSHSGFLEIHNIGVRLSLTEPDTASKQKAEGETSETKAQAGTRALQLFFLQILSQTKWIIDFRQKSFIENGDAILEWAPAPLYYELPGIFVTSIRDLYRGYYLGDEARFDQALKDLDLFNIKSTFIKHFGPEDQTNVRFKLADFQRTFAEIFEACSRDRVALRPEFFILGVMLLGIYEYLESSNQGYNVRNAFFEADNTVTKSTTQIEST